MAVSQKIISGNDQPNGGRAITSVAGARGLDDASIIDTNHTLNPVTLAASLIDQSIATIDARLDTRFDDVNYYYGSGVQG